MFSSGADKAYDSVPDAWIYGDGFAVLVESKVNGGFSPEQSRPTLNIWGAVKRAKALKEAAEFLREVVVPIVATHLLY
jgi:hypothetical protein